MRPTCYIDKKRAWSLIYDLQIVIILFYFLFFQYILSPKYMPNDNAMHFFDSNNELPIVHNVSLSFFPFLTIPWDCKIKNLAGYISNFSSLSVFHTFMGLLIQLNYVFDSQEALFAFKAISWSIQSAMLNHNFETPATGTRNRFYFTHSRTPQDNRFHTGSSSLKTLTLLR